MAYLYQRNNSLLTNFPIAQVVEGNAVGWQNIVEHNGLTIAAIGMLIVFCALVFITLFIGALPKVLAALDPFLPEMHGSHGPPAAAERTKVDEEKVIAAIGMVLHRARQNTGQTK